MSSIKDLFDKKLGFGFMRLPVLEDESIDFDKVCQMVDYYIGKGFKYFDTAYVYHSGTSESAFKKCIVSRYPREQVILADKMPMFQVKEEADLPRIFAEQLERCGVDYFDLYLLHNLNKNNYETCKKVNAFEYAAKLREEGKVKFFGFSFHDTAQMLDEILTAHPEVDFVQLQINYYDWDSEEIQSGKCYEVAKKHGKPVIVMEPVKGGSLVNIPQKAQDIVKALPGNVTPPQLAIRYAASLPEVAIVLSGMSTMEQLQENTAYMQDMKPITDEEKKAIEQIIAAINEVDTIKCTACKYCVEECPQKINIPGIFRTYNYIMQFNNGQVQKQRYEQVTKDGGRAADCLKCGKCEGHCPQHLPIRETLEEMSKLFD